MNVIFGLVLGALLLPFSASALNSIHIFSFLFGILTALVILLIFFLFMVVYGPSKDSNPAATPRASKSKNARAMNTPFTAHTSRACQSSQLDGFNLKNLLLQNSKNIVDESGTVVHSSWMRLTDSPLTEDLLKERPPGPLSFSVTHSTFKLPTSIEKWLMEADDSHKETQELFLATMTATSTFPRSRHARNTKASKTKVSSSAQYASSDFTDDLPQISSRIDPEASSGMRFTWRNLGWTKLSTATAQFKLKKLLLNNNESSKPQKSELKELPASMMRRLESLDLQRASKDELLSRALGLDIAKLYSRTSQLESGFPLLSPVSLLKLLDEKDRNVFVVLRSKGNLTIYSDETCCFPIETLNLKNYDIRLWPCGKLLNNEAYLKIYPIQFAEKASDKSLYLYLPTPRSKEALYLAIYEIVHRIPFTHSRFYLDSIDRFRYAVYYPFGFYDFLGAAKFLPAEMQRSDPAALFKSTSSKSSSTLLAHQMSLAWLNALVTRGFVALARSVKFRESLLLKLNRKVARVDRPKFLSEIVVTDVSMGTQSPILNNPQLLEMDAHGQVAVNFTVAYAGGFKMLLATDITIPSPTDLVKPVQVSIQVSVHILKLCGDFKLMFLPLERSNRMWMGFYPEPAPMFEADIELVVGNVGLRWKWIKAQLLDLVRKLFYEQAVLPSMDDIDFGDPLAAGGIFDNFEDSLEHLPQEQKSAYDALITSEYQHQTEISKTYLPNPTDARFPTRTQNVFGNEYTETEFLPSASSSQSSGASSSSEGEVIDLRGKATVGSPPILGSPPPYAGTKSISSEDSDFMKLPSPLQSDKNAGSISDVSFFDHNSD